MVFRYSLRRNIDVNRVSLWLKKSKNKKTVGNTAYKKLFTLVLNFASTYQTENPRGFSEVGEN